MMVLEAGCVGRCGLNAVVWEKDADLSTSAKSVSLMVSSTPVRAWPSDQFEGADGHRGERRDEHHWRRACC